MNRLSMYQEAKHVCMLTRPPDSHIPPTSSCCRRLFWKLRALLLPCEWHHGYKIYIRSQKGLKLERDRQLKSGYRFVWHPYSPIRFCWDVYSLIILTSGLFYMPVQVFTDSPSPYDIFVLFNDATAAVDVVTNFLTGYNDEDNKIIVLKPKMIATNYLKNVFIFDLIGALPLQLIFYNYECIYPLHTVMYVFKLFRYFKTFDKYSSLSHQIELSYFWFVISTCFLRAAFLLHWLTYIHYQVPLLCANIYGKNILEAVPPTKEKKWMDRVMFGNYSMAEKYIENLYAVCGLCIGVGYYLPVEDAIIPELVLTGCVGILGLLCIMHSFMFLLSLFIHRQNCNYIFNGRLKELEEYMVKMRLPRYLQQKVKLYINYKYNGQYFNEKMILNTISVQIKQNINMHCCKQLVLKVPLFHDLPIHVINSIIFGLVQVLYMPGEEIVRSRQASSCMYLVSAGSACVLNARGREVAHVRDGDHFGEHGLLDLDVFGDTTVVALEITEIFKLTREVFERSLQPYPLIKRRLENAIVRRRRWPATKPSIDATNYNM